MRTNQRNKRKVWYALYQGVTETVDADGNYTGEYEITYTDPVEAKMNVSGGRGQADIDVFGIDNPFTRTAITDDLTTPFDTDTIFWFGADPQTEPHNYRCTGVADTVNTRTIALAEIDVRHEADNG